MVGRKLMRMWGKTKNKHTKQNEENLLKFNPLWVSQHPVSDVFLVLFKMSSECDNINRDGWWATAEIKFISQLIYSVEYF